MAQLSIFFNPFFIYSFYPEKTSQQSDISYSVQKWTIQLSSPRPDNFKLNFYRESMAIMQGVHQLLLDLNETFLQKYENMS